MTQAQYSYTNPCRTLGPLLGVLWMILFCQTYLEICEVSKVSAKELGSWTNQPLDTVVNEFVFEQVMGSTPDALSLSDQCVFEIFSTSLENFTDWGGCRTGNVSFTSRHGQKSCGPNMVIRRPIFEWTSKHHVLQQDWIMYSKWG